LNIELKFKSYNG